MKLNYLLGIGIVLALVGASLLVAFGFLYIKPYINVRNFKEATCTTIQSFPTGQEVPCQCAADGSSSCVSFYPCLKIWVNFTKTEHSDTRNVTLYDSYETYFLQRETLQVRTFYLECKYENYEGHLLRFFCNWVLYIDRPHFLLSFCQHLFPNPSWFVGQVVFNNRSDMAGVQ